MLRACLKEGRPFVALRCRPLAAAKYLDCGADMFFEAVIANWLTAGGQPNGMVIRLQGFDKGVFGGNFHTHNTLHLPPGLDVVAYSNGADYARGMRYCVAQAAAGRVVMSVDSTALLNERHVLPADDQWQTVYPPDGGDMLPFDAIRTYGPERGQLAIVTYGNGVLTALRAQAELELQAATGLEAVAVIDSPLLSAVSPALGESTLAPPPPLRGCHPLRNRPFLPCRQTT
eukprot:SAG22_NODE_2638_length_2347_cov_2.305605_2_plen_230_part_00